MEGKYSVSVDNSSQNGYTYIAVRCSGCNKLIRSEIVEPCKDYQFDISECPECKIDKNYIKSKNPLEGGKRPKPIPTVG